VPLQTNASLLAVNDADAGTGGRDDWDAPVPASSPATAPAGALKWAGDVDAYYRETVDRVWTAAGVDVVAVRRLIIDSSVARAAAVDTDDVVTFVDPTGVTVHARVARVSIAELVGITPALQTARLDLQTR
jgi:hypothetical protein